MSGFTIEIETDSDDDCVNLKLGSDNLSAGLEHLQRPTNLNASHQSILNAKVGPLSKNASEQKTYWLLAEIYPKHLGTGEITAKNSSLSERIRSRGMSGDDCGHIIAASLGGKMVDFNLFPQNKLINRGWKGWSKYWRKAIEMAMMIWLKNPFLENPRVEFQVRFFYNDKKYPDRPNSGKFVIKFKCDGRKKNKKINDYNGKEIPMTLYATLKGDLMNVIKNESDYVPEPNHIKLNWEQFYSLNIQQFEEFIRLFIKDLKTAKPKPYRPMALVDFIPVVGSIRSLYHGVEDAVNGDTTDATVNILLGVGGLALDVFTLGMAGSAVKSIGQAAAKEGIKTMTKAAAKEGVKTIAKTAAQEGTKAIITTEMRLTMAGAGAVMGGLMRNGVRNH